MVNPGVTHMSEATFEISGAVALLRLRRPEKHNVFNRELIERTAAAVTQVSETDAAAVVLTGEGPSFCAGADLHELRELTPETAAGFISTLHDLFRLVRAAPQIYIAAVNGHALGAGCELAAACDLRVAASNALLGMPEIRVGIPSVIEAALLAPLVGLGRAAEMVYTGKPLTASEAHRAGLVNRVAPPEQLLAESLALAQTIAGHSHAALRLQKRLVQNWITEPFPLAMQQSIEAFAAAYQNDGPRRTISAFLERPRGGDTTTA